ncbi:cytochrome c3 family protein [Methylogaea oryzae]|uniref:cytochrome c3 family protein n=1 Tax=Methylogaea oryzae TaxID=1295382 RepID=UPI0006CFE5A0|nr:cytochrome c3 family protein [Methylogaea oryzae]
MSAKALWTGAILVTLLIGGYLGYALFAHTPLAQAGKALFLPGPATHGHYQIELACSACHKPFQGAPQKACVDCHGEALKAAEDSHSNRKFTDPRNAAMLRQVDALRCVTCHREHRPEQTRAMDVTQPDDFCYACHNDVAKERPSHKDFAPDSCANAGCHNYHDNKALYEDFLAAHLHEPDHKQPALLPLRNLAEQVPAGQRKPPLADKDANAPAGVSLPPEQLRAWAETSHAKSGINCADCHQPSSPTASPPPGKTGSTTKPAKPATRAKAKASSPASTACA